MIEVKLPTKEKQGDEVVTVTKSFVIEEASFFQFAKLLKILNKAFDELKADGEMTQFLESVFGDETTPETPTEIMEELDKDFMVKAMGAFNFLAVKVPDRVMDIMSTLSGIEKDFLEKQKMVRVMDVYDAILEANDIEALVERLKKSFGATKAATKFLNLKRKATQQ
jgi:hypothetical protein